jgi:hypothetical protein
MDNALVFTSKGNLPESQLQFFDGWDFDQTGITYFHGYKLNGEIVKRSAARFQFPDGQTLKINQGAVSA